MKTIFPLLVFFFALTGCDVIQTPIIENNYQSALASGDINQQLHYIDELSALNSSKHQALIEQKEKLSPYLLQIVAEPKNISNISDDLIAEMVAFSPNSSSLSFAKQYLANKKRVTAAYNQTLADLASEKLLLAQVQSTPNHVTTYNTDIKLKHVPLYLLLSDEMRSFLSEYGKLELNGYQIEAIVNRLSHLRALNLKAIDELGELNELNHGSELLSTQEYEAYNHDISQVFLWLYKKHLIMSYQYFTQQNKHFISLINNQYGVQSLDDVWLNKVEPLAKKAVMESKLTHLSLLNKISVELGKSANQMTRLSDIVETNNTFETLFLGLLWPNDGLINFEKSSSENTLILKEKVIRLQQL